MPVYYVDIINGLDTNSGATEALAWQTINKAATTASAGDTVHIQATGNYTLTAAQTFTNSGGNSGPIIYMGYTTTPGADDGRPVITSSTASVHLFNISSKVGICFRHLKFTHTGSTRGCGMIALSADAVRISVIDCVFDGCLDAINGDYIGFYKIEELLVYRCEILNSTQDGIHNSGETFLWGSYIHDCTNDGMKANSSSASGRMFISQTVIEDCDRGIHLGGVGTMILDHSVMYSNTSHGVIKDGTGLIAMGITNCVFYGNGGFGVNVAAGVVIPAPNSNNGYGSNTSGARNGWNAGTGDITLTGDPFTNAGAADYSLDNTASEGAALRNAGWPGVALFGTGYADVGALRHQDAGGGGAVYHGAMAGGLVA